MLRCVDDVFMHLLQRLINPAAEIENSNSCSNSSSPDKTEVQLEEGNTSTQKVCPEFMLVLALRAFVVRFPYRSKKNYEAIRGTLSRHRTHLSSIRSTPAPIPEPTNDDTIRMVVTILISFIASKVPSHLSPITTVSSAKWQLL